MEQLLRSVVSSGVHLAESCKFQHHIFMDGGMQSDNEPGFKALQLIRVLKSTIENVLVCRPIFTAIFDCLFNLHSYEKLHDTLSITNFY